MKDRNRLAVLKKISGDLCSERKDEKRGLLMSQDSRKELGHAALYEGRWDAPLATYGLEAVGATR